MPKQNEQQNEVEKRKKEMEKRDENNAKKRAKYAQTQAQREQNRVSAKASRQPSLCVAKIALLVTCFSLIDPKFEQRANKVFFWVMTRSTNFCPCIDFGLLSFWTCKNGPQVDKLIPGKKRK